MKKWDVTETFEMPDGRLVSVPIGRNGYMMGNVELADADLQWIKRQRFIRKQRARQRAHEVAKRQDMALTAMRRALA
jgi:hypothetical protein